MLASFHIVLAMKPISGNFAQNAIEHGVAGLNIDAGRIETEDNLNGGAYGDVVRVREPQRCLDGGELYRGAGKYQQPQGRFPANLILESSEEVKTMFPETISVKGQCQYVGTKNNKWIERGGIAKEGHIVQWQGRGDSGSNVRFFKQVKSE